MAATSFFCPKFHVWQKLYAYRDSFELQCRYCGARAKVLRRSDMDMTSQIAKINSDPILREHPDADTTAPETIFDPKAR